MTVNTPDLTVDWYGYATTRLATADSDLVCYLDPGRYGVITGEWSPDTRGVAHPVTRDRRPHDGDVVLVTHVHHYDPDGIRRVADDDATLVVPSGLDVNATDRTDERPIDLGFDLVTLDPADETLLAGHPVWTVHSYNEPGGPHTRGDGSPIHPKGRGVGYLLDLDGTRVFFPGDTDVLDGHAELDVDLFLPPIGGSFTMDRHAAAALAADLRPQLTVPVHYNTFAALETDDREFAADVAAAGVPVALDR
jgi:L-ascorbate metabolism protein UlaG (beta-lactamase superfamily)